MNKDLLFGYLFVAKRKEEKKKWAVIEEDDGIHVRPIRDGKIIDTPIVKRFDYRNKKN